MAYASDLRLFFSFLIEKKVAKLVDIDLDVIHEYAEKSEKNYKPSSINRKLIAIKVFLLFLSKKKLISLPAIEQLQFKNTADFFPSLMNVNEIKKFFKEFESRKKLNWFSEHENGFKEKKRDYRNALILETLYVMGSRVSELCNLKMSDLDLANELVTLLGKGNKTRVVPILNRLATKFSIYLERIRPFFDRKRSCEEGYVFLNFRGGKMSRIAIWKIIKEIFSQMKSSKNFSPHSFRHMYATHLLKNGSDIRVVQELLGHENIQTTEKYTHLANKDVEETLRDFHPFYR